MYVIDARATKIAKTASHTYNTHTSQLNPIEINNKTSRERERINKIKWENASACVWVGGANKPKNIETAQIKTKSKYV